MDENLLYNVLIIASIIGIIAVTIIIFTNKTSEPFTELYFEDHQNLPKIVQLNQIYNFQFSIHNLENKDENYFYLIHIDADGNDIFLDSSYISLKNNQTATISKNFMLTENFENAKIIVELIGKNQEIHFWVKQ